LILIPYLILSLLLGASLPILGKLSVVYDQAGKARIVAITNSWIQLCLSPLHDRLFNILKRIPEDGTFDQNKPFNNLIIRLKDRPGVKLNGFDLSAATDRLPLTLQRNILNLMNFPGDAWFDLLSIPYRFENKFIRYEVGQPMGAYTSFAMLAITHHVIVQIAAIKAGKLSFNAGNLERFTDYCVLGDDIVIADDAVSQEYLKLMETLGVKISMGKSICSSEFTEFAKRLKGVNTDYINRRFIGGTHNYVDYGDERNLIKDYSPIGAGLIVYSLRNK
jgi:hypothetical protein